MYLSKETTVPLILSIWSFLINLIFLRKTASVKMFYCQIWRNVVPNFEVFFNVLICAYFCESCFIFENFSSPVKAMPVLSFNGTMPIQWSILCIFKGFKRKMLGPGVKHTTF